MERRTAPSGALRRLGHRLARQPHGLVRPGLARLAQVLHAQEDAPAATLAAKKLVQLDPLNEQANMLLIASYARSGRRGHALRQYLACRRTLLDELGVEPAEETTEMQQRILAGERV